MPTYKVVATVKSMEFPCPNGYRVGDKMEIETGKITGFKCTSAFCAIGPFIFALRFGAEFPWSGEGKDVNLASCPDHRRHVTFEIRRIRKETGAKAQAHEVVNK